MIALADESNGNKLLVYESQREIQDFGLENFLTFKEIWHN
jgi:hypothetical protein